VRLIPGVDPRVSSSRTLSTVNLAKRSDTGHDYPVLDRFPAFHVALRLVDFPWNASLKSSRPCNHLLSAPNATSPSREAAVTYEKATLTQHVDRVFVKHCRSRRLSFHCATSLLRGTLAAQQKLPSIARRQARLLCLQAERVKNLLQKLFELVPPLAVAGLLAT